MSAADAKLKHSLSVGELSVHLFMLTDSMHQCQAADVQMKVQLLSAVIHSLLMFICGISADYRDIELVAARLSCETDIEASAGHLRVQGSHAKQPGGLNDAVNGEASWKVLGII